MSRSTLAARIGVRTGLLRAWETGVYAPGTNALLGWAAGLNCVIAVQPLAGLPVLGVGPVQALTELRRRRGLSQGQVAHTAGFRQPQLSQWEKGRHTPGLRMLADWAAALGCRLVVAPLLVGVAA